MLGWIRCDSIRYGLDSVSRLLRLEFFPRDFPESRATRLCHQKANCRLLASKSRAPSLWPGQHRAPSIEHRAKRSEPIEQVESPSKRLWLRSEWKYQLDCRFSSPTSSKPTGWEMQKAQRILLRFLGHFLLLVPGQRNLALGKRPRGSAGTRVLTNSCGVFANSFY